MYVSFRPVSSQKEVLPYDDVQNILTDDISEASVNRRWSVRTRHEYLL